jgi:succinate dehydrogenase/fumarate reductase flavoprotein subunit
VVIVEATGETGGNGAFSTGYMAFADYALQHEKGIRDDPERLVRDMVEEVERQRQVHDPVFDWELARLYADETKHSYSFLAELGFRFGRFIPRPRQHTTERMVALEDPTQFRDLFLAALKPLGVKVLLRSRATSLLRASNVVTGACIESGVGRIDLKAYAVIVATGGYQASEDLRRRFRPSQNPRAPYPGLHTARGDGQLMMQAVGADLVNMQMIPELIRVASAFVEDCIGVNAVGRRFHDEAGPYDERLQALEAQPEGIGYYLCDARMADRDAQLIAEMPSPPKLFTTLADAARAIGCDFDVLAETVARWNSIIRSQASADPDFGRVVFPQPRIGIEIPPFSVIPMVRGIATTVGGARVGKSMRVLDRKGRPIAGLFAVGDAVGLLTPATGLGGIHLSSAVTTGRLAGLAAAVETEHQVGHVESAHRTRRRRRTRC